jgi:integral membrane protein
MVLPGIAGDLYCYPMAVLAAGAAPLLTIFLTFIMKQLLSTNIGRLRIIGFLEGISLLVLIFIAVPLKYIGHDPSIVKAMGPIHGALFLLFIVNTVSVGVEHKWQLKTTSKVLLACIIPFGTFYIDRKILRNTQSI